MTNVQLWSPDTCGCRIYQRVDDDGTITNITQAEAKALVMDKGRRRTLPPSRICEIHAPPTRGRDTPDVHAAFDRVMQENQGKNLALGEIQRVRPDVTGERYRWSFDADRNLQVELDGVELSPEEKGQIQSALHARFGNGRARVM